MVNSSIDNFRKEKKHRMLDNIEGEHVLSSVPSAEDKISYDEVIYQIQLLSPAYRAVFNLYAIDGYTHQEISEMLGISIGTSKSNLSRARKQLQKALKKTYKDEFA